MPTYDYQCRSCGIVTELIHSMSESGPTTCEECGGDLRRVLFPAGIIFKGPGFYRTDSRSSRTESGSGKPADTTRPESSGAESSAKSEAKTDSTAGEPRSSVPDAKSSPSDGA